MNAGRAATLGGASALPIDIALSVIPSLPRPLLARFVALAIERMDGEDGDPELEQDDWDEDGEGQAFVDEQGRCCLFLRQGDCEDDEDNGDAEHWRQPLEGADAG